MGRIGTIKEVSTSAGQHTVFVEDGPGPGVTATILQSGAVDFQPMRGDRVLYHDTGQEIVVSAIFSEDASSGPGEWLVFSRNASGAVTATLHLKADGEASVVNDAGFFKLTSAGQLNANDNFTVDP